MNKPLGSSRASTTAPLPQQRSRIPLAVVRLRKSNTKETSDAEGDIENTFDSGREIRHYEEHLEDGYDSDTKDFAETSSQIEEINQIEDDERSEILAYPQSSEEYEDEDEAVSGVLAYPKSSAGNFEDKENTSLQASSLCQYTAQCNTGSHDYRKVISHIFGRNKKCTTQIPDSCWIIYCRKHYQRTRYRTSKAQVKNYFRIQFDNLVRQLARMEKWGGVRSWTIGLRKKEREILSAEDSALAQLQASGASIDNETVARVHQCRERYLLPYVGDNKTYDHVRRFTRAIQQEVERSGAEELPGFELLPDIDLGEHPAGGVRNSIKFETTHSSIEPSCKQDKQLPSTSRDLPTSKAPNRRRLVQGTPLREDDENDIRLEGDGIESPAEITEISDSALLKNTRTIEEVRIIEEVSITEYVLRTGWFAKEKLLKPPPSRFTTPESSSSRPDSLRKGANNRSTSKQSDLPDTERLSFPLSYVRSSKARKKQGVHSDTSGTSFQGYDPWPNSTPEQAKAQCVKPSTPVSDPNIQSTGSVSKGGKKRSASPVTSLSDFFSYRPQQDTKRARISYSEPSKKPSSCLAISDSPSAT